MANTRLRTLRYIIAVLLALTLLSSCKSQKKIEADIWNLEPRDGSIYRVVEKDGKKQEEFILCTDESARTFKAMTNNDLKKWSDYYIKNCECK